MCSSCTADLKRSKRALYSIRQQRYARESCTNSFSGVCQSQTVRNDTRNDTCFFLHSRCGHRISRLLTGNSHSHSDRTCTSFILPCLPCCLSPLLPGCLACRWVPDAVLQTTVFLFSLTWGAVVFFSTYGANKSNDAVWGIAFATAAVAFVL